MDNILSRTSSVRQSPLRLIQITDLHIRAVPGGIQGCEVNTDVALARVLDQIRLYENPLDLVVATGDLVHDPQPSAYRRLRNMLMKLNQPVCCLPGNHDDPYLAEDILKGGMLSCPKLLTLDDWVLILLDSTVKEAVHGYLDEEELALLDETLSRHPARHALIFLHHPVYPIGSPWMDRVGLHNADALFAVLERHAQVRGVVFGHIHQCFERVHKGIRLFGSPATSVQFAPRSKTLMLDSLPPAYRRLALYPDGQIVSDIAFLHEAARKRA
ncbi:phosphodiesterase [Thiorhodospira sibirica]|uniref:phosphodiesterase n=1 Tax=Thiorhodospira sibirica TaxID=154347 RepID=UPI00022C0AD8|nr:phosphodiesterase [Thiorhodospira sibirica]